MGEAALNSEWMKKPKPEHNVLEVSVNKAGVLPVYEASQGDPSVTLEADLSSDPGNKGKLIPAGPGRDVKANMPKKADGKLNLQPDKRGAVVGNALISGIGIHGEKPIPVKAKANLSPKSAPIHLVGDPTLPQDSHVAQTEMERGSVVDERAKVSPVVQDLEEENRALVRVIAKLQAENDKLRGR
jgi:hypothetical protein